MIRLIAAAAVALFAFECRADDKQFFLSADGTTVIEKRVGDLEKRVAALEAKLADSPFLPPAPLKAKSPTERGPVNPLKKVTYSVCVNGRCTTHQCDDASQVPPGAKILSVSTDSTCPAGVCSGYCDCFGGGYYCAAGKCPVGFGSAASAPPAAPDRWYLGKNLGRGRRGGCSSCQ